MRAAWFAVSLLAATLLSGQTLTTEYYHFNRPVTLSVDRGYLALTARAGVDPDSLVAAALPELAGRTVPMQRATERFITLVRELTEVELSARIERLNADPAVRLAAPVYRHGRVLQTVSTRFIARFIAGTDSSAVAAFAAERGLTAERRIFGDLYLLDGPAGASGIELANGLRALPEVQWAQPHFIYPDWTLLPGRETMRRSGKGATPPPPVDKTSATVDDPLWVSQWAHVNTGQLVATGAAIGNTAVNGMPDADMDVDEAWDVLVANGDAAGGSSAIVVAIIDSGTDLDHPDLAANVIAGADYSGDGQPNGDVGTGDAHGTCTAGIVGAVGDNATGVAGIAYRTTIMPIKIFNNAGSAGSADIAGAINYAWQNGADILSNSWGGGAPEAALETAISNARTLGRGGLGAIVLFSSGNDGHDPVNYPAYLSDVVAVGASSMFDEKKSPGSSDHQHWWGGNYGTALDIVAPTINYTTDVAGGAGYESGDYIATFNGTSAACPNAAGVAALVLAANDALTVDQVQAILENTADRIEHYPYDGDGWNRHVGHGRVNAYRAVRAAYGFDGTTPLIRHTALQPTSNTAIQVIEADITDDAGIASAVVWYRADNGSGFGAWNSVGDGNGPSGNTFAFHIPGQPHGSQVEYYIEATDVSGNRATLPVNADGATLRGTAAVPFTFGVDEFTPETAVGPAISWGFSGGTFSGSVNVSSAVRIGDLDVVLNSSGALTSVFDIHLQSPAGTRVALFVENGTGSGIGTTFDDEASALLGSANNPFSGDYQPDNRLSAFDGEDAAGIWTLRIYNGANLNNGSVSSWQLVFNSEDASDQGLPVTLTALTGYWRDGFAELTWTTAAELDNAGFEVYRSADPEDGYVLRGSWLSDSTLAGGGTRNTATDYRFVDPLPGDGRVYYYRLTDVSINGLRTHHGPLAVTAGGDGPAPLGESGLPERFELSPAWPNPFNPGTALTVAVPRLRHDRPVRVTVAVYDNLGRRVRTLMEERKAPGRYALRWDGRNADGRQVASGTYFVMMRTSGTVLTRQVTLLR